jgi:hypothetical protein
MAYIINGMKKYIFTLIVCLIPLRGYSTKYVSGTLTTDTWNEEIIVTADAIIGNGVTITINPGVIVRFYPGVKISVTGTGVLTAIGNITDRITFTSFNGLNQGWGHLYFNNSSATTNSKIAYCIVEKGSSSDYGGGVYSNSGKLEVSYSIFRNNKSPRGGGIGLLFSGTTISNCVFSNNIATVDGAGLFAWGSSSLVSNCLFYQNTATTNGGGMYLGNPDSFRAINITFASNSANSTASAVAFNYNVTPTIRPVILNSIIWGSTESKSIKYFGYITKAPGDFTNCAIQASTGYYTNSISLDATNNAASGPKFTNPGSSDYSITFISPCRDAGTNSGAPTSDIVNNPRIGTTDIGAFENIYSRWNGTTSTAWEDATNWEMFMVPGATLNAIVPPVTNNPLISSANPTITNLITESGGSLAVGGGRLLTATNFTNKGSFSILPTGKATFTNIINSGSFKLETDASDLSSLIFTNFSGSNITHELYLTGGGDKTTYKWHYISTPLTTIATSVFTSTTLDLAQFIESRPSLTTLEGWVAFDGYVYSSGLQEGPTFNNLSPGKGYDYYYASDHEYTFSGQPNSGSTATSVTLHYSGTDDNLYGYNLVGNPYPSGIDWEYITSNGFPSNTSKAVYFTSNNKWITYNAGVSVPAGAATSIIPPMQGFFVKTFQDNTSFTVPLAARTHDNIHSRYKGNSTTSEEIPLIRLSTNEGVVRDETVVRLDLMAQINLDYDFDAFKIFSGSGTQLYTKLYGVNFAINGIPFPLKSIEIPVIVKFTSSGSHSISADQILNLDKYEIKLKDNITGLTTDLKYNPIVTFSANSGTISDRFILIVSRLSTGIENPVSDANSEPFKVYQSYSDLVIQTIGEEWNGTKGNVQVFDLSGKCVSDYNNVQFTIGSDINVPSPQTKGFYIIKIRSGLKSFAEKIIIH